MTYDVQLLVEKNFKQRLKKIKNTINLWKSRGLSIHGKVNIIKTLLLPKMIYASSVICTPPDGLSFFVQWERQSNLVPRSSTVIRKEDLVKFDFEHAQCQRGSKYGLFYHCACSYSLL